jgi:hypothetical protein
MGTEKYIKGFNDGYLLKQHKPELIEKLLGTPSTNEYTRGLRDGERTYEQQKVKSRTQEIKDLKSMVFLAASR